MCSSSSPNDAVRVAALYDVHAMPSPLAAVLEEVDGEGVDGIVFGGDILIGPCPREAIELARSVDAHFVLGNCDRQPEEWERREVDGDTLAWLAGLPLTVSLDGVLYCHAAPDDDRRTPFDVAAAVAEVRASGWPEAEEFIRENLLAAPSRAEAVAHFEQLRAG